MVDNLEEVFSDSVITSFPEGSSRENLFHLYKKNRRGVDIEAALGMAGQAYREVVAWYENLYGEKFDKFNLKDRVDSVRQRFMLSRSFIESLNALRVEPNDTHKVNLPWWVESLAGETKCNVHGEDIHSTFAPMHSYEFQLLRSGVMPKGEPVSGVGIDGVVLTGGNSKRKVIMGVRAGSSYSNTLHVLSGGSLRATDNFKNGTESIYDIFVREELKPEMGDLQETSIRSIVPIARTKDVNRWNGDVTYVFRVETNLEEDEAVDLWVKNPHRDKAEHSELVFVPSDRSSIRKFISLTYRGKVENRGSRKDDDRYLLHTGALDLCAFAGLSPSELRDSYKEGSW